MGITQIGPSEREKRAREQQQAAVFQPKALELSKLSLELADNRRRLSQQLKASDLAGTLRQLQDNLRQASALCRGSAAIVKPYALTADLTYVYNVVRSLAQAHPTLGTTVIAKEKKEIGQRLDTVIQNIGRMCVDLNVDEDAELPAGQNLHEGEPPAVDGEIDYDMADAPTSLDELDLEGITQFAEYDNEMPGVASPELTKVLELPVMATFNRPTSLEELNSRGFDGVALADYIVLRKAYILGVNVGQCKAKSLDVQQVVKASLAKISDKINDRVDLVCELGIRYHKGGWMFFWFGPSSYHRSLGGRLDTRLSVTEFKFPFGAPAARA